MSVYTPTPSATVSPLRQRMLDDMRMRQFAEHTQEGCIRAVRNLAAFLARSPHTAHRTPLRPRICVVSSCTWWTPAPAPSPSTPPSPG
jgi:hypothetical protein